MDFVAGVITHIDSYNYALKSQEVKNLHNGELINPIQELIEAAEPFLSGDVVDETTVTIILMNRLEYAIKVVKEKVANGRLY